MRAELSDERQTIIRRGSLEDRLRYV